MKIAIYGAGHFGSCFFQAIPDAKESVCYWLDDKLAGGCKFDKPIIKVSEADKNVKVLIAVTPLVRSERHLIASKLKKLGFTDVVDFFSAAKIYKSVFKHYAKLAHLWMSPICEEMIEPDEIKWFDNRLADDKSREVLSALVSFRQHLDMEHYPEPDCQQEYFPEDVPFLISEPIRMLDCGAYIGDTVEDFFSLADKNKLMLNSIVSFEPDKDNFNGLCDVIAKRKLHSTKENLVAFPAGVWHENTVLNFSSGMTSSSNVSKSTVISESNCSQVPVVKLDDVCFGMSVNFIKMDIEGAEQEALSGCKKIIAQQQPVLAICVYHKPADLWEIPRLIDEISPNYQYYLRVHEHLGLSTVLYCLPKK